jgi:hypothetical protein
MSSRLATHTHTLPPEDHVLLLEAIQHWHDSIQFSDEQVAQVKAIFRSVFGLQPDTVLVGSALPDAIVLQPPHGNGRVFYAIVQAEGGAWEAMELESDAQLTFSKSMCFRLLLAFLSDSTGGLTHVSRRWQGQNE